MRNGDRERSSGIFRHGRASLGPGPSFITSRAPTSDFPRRDQRRRRPDRRAALLSTPCGENACRDTPTGTRSHGRSPRGGVRCAPPRRPPHELPTEFPDSVQRPGRTSSPFLGRRLVTESGEVPGRSGDVPGGRGRNRGDGRRRRSRRSRRSRRRSGKAPGARSPPRGSRNPLSGPESSGGVPPAPAGGSTAPKVHEGPGARCGAQGPGGLRGRPAVRPAGWAVRTVRRPRRPAVQLSPSPSPPEPMES